MNRAGIWIIVLAAAGIGWYYWHNKSSSSGTQQLNQAVQQDLAYYTAWQQAQNSVQNIPQNSSPSTGQSASNTRNGTVTSNTQTLPASV